MATGQGTRGPKPAHSRAAIARAGIVLADEHGLAAVTMRAVAADLGTGAGSLYRYVGSRDEVIALMVDAVMAAGLDAAEPPNEWRPAVLGVARSLLDVYRRHPWMADVAPDLASGASVADYLETCLRAMRTAPGTDRRKLEAAAILLGTVTLFARPTGDGAFPIAEIDTSRWPLLAAAAGADASVEDSAAGLFERTVIGAVDGILVG